MVVAAVLAVVDPGDEVIVDGVARIFFPGMPVKVDNESASAGGQ